MAHPRCLDRRFAAFVPLLVALGACPEAGKPPPGKLTVIAEPASAPADGTMIRLVAEAVDGYGKPGVGDVEFRVSRGKPVGAPRALYRELKDGKAGGAVYCMKDLDPYCHGKQIVRASWEGLSAYTEIEFQGEELYEPDAGEDELPPPPPPPMDGGFDGGTNDAGASDGGAGDGGHTSGGDQ